MARQDKTPQASWIIMPASIAVITAGLYLAKGILVPCTLAVLLSFLLSPVCDWLERWKLGRIPAVLITATVGFSMLGVVVWTTVIQVSHLAPKIPEYRENVEAKFNSVNEYAVAVLSQVTRRTHKIADKTTDDVLPPNPDSEPQGSDKFPFSVRIITSPTSPIEIFGGMFGTLLEVLGTTGIVIVLVVFFLIGREDLRDRFIHLAGKGEVTVTTQMLEDASARVSRYLTILFLLNLTFGISVGVGLVLIGVPNAILWGILAGVLRFIPYIGPWIAATMPVGLSLAISTGWGLTILTVLLFVVLELFNNNLFEPWLYGKKTGVSAVAVMLAAVFWTWLWGPMGLLLATPLTVCVLVVGKHVPQLSFLNILLGTDPVFEPQKHVYQRLLAGDMEEAAQLLESSLEHKSLVDVYDNVLIPALAIAETHWQLGDLNDGKHKFIMQSLKEMLQDRSDREQEKQAAQAKKDVATDDAAAVNTVSAEAIKSKSSPLKILCLPARSEADEITAMMLAQILGTTGSSVQASSVTSLADEMIDLIDPSSVDVICVAATRPAAVMHARHLCKRLRVRFPAVKLVVGLWDSIGDLNKAQDRIGCGATVFSTLADTLKEILLMSGSPLSQPDQPSLSECDPKVTAPT
ncbi:MAG: AI-2E family transporter [Planctomycetota bacterium]|nr:MAG: AI-2E family transporter [Planctomycetota bacterium]